MVIQELMKKLGVKNKQKDLKKEEEKKSWHIIFFFLLCLKKF
jgi:hypothetical protein